jgi:hypothetical protein
MKITYWALFLVVSTAAMTTSAFAVPTDRVPDTASTAGLLGVAFAGLTGLRAWLKK